MGSGHRALVCVGLIAMGVIFCIVHIWRSVSLKKGFSETTMKMYIGFVVFTVIGAIGVAGVITGDALAAILGASVGYALGNKPWEGAQD